MALGSIQLKLYIYSGTEGSYSESDLKYTINKERLGTDLNIILEVGELIRDYIDITFNNDYLCHTKWVSAVVYYKDLQGDLLDHSNPQVFNYLAVDGYGFFEDEVNPELSRNALVTSSVLELAGVLRGGGRCAGARLAGDCCGDVQRWRDGDGARGGAPGAGGEEAATKRGACGWRGKEAP